MSDRLVAPMRRHHTPRHAIEGHPNPVTVADLLADANLTLTVDRHQTLDSPTYLYGRDYAFEWPGR